LIERRDDISVTRQCGLLEVARSSYYYESAGESALNLELMRRIDEQYMKTPFYGSPRMTEVLKRKGYGVNHKRIERLMRVMGIAAIYPKRQTSQPESMNRIYPYLLGDLEINHPDQVWASDITDIRLAHGFVFLTAVMDWFSRYVLAWELSILLDKEFCLTALDRALGLSRPEIFNSDQGGQYTSLDFTGRLEAKGIRISMDGRGRVFDNVFIERLWRTVKYEEVYLHAYETVDEARRCLAGYFIFYNTERLHSSLGYRTPREVYFPGSAKALAGAESLR
jgi:putative transposase